MLGTLYGGDGRTTFALPDLRGRAPIHTGDGFSEGDQGGQEEHAVQLNEMPQHTHQAQASAQDAAHPIPESRILAAAPSRLYHPPTNLHPLSESTIADSGGGQGHNNMMPFLTLNFCIALQGSFPPSN